VSAPRDTVFLLDVDDTLLDNDRFAADLGARLEMAFGAAQRTRYWALFSRLRAELGYADYLAALQQLRAGLEDEPELLQMSEFLLEYPFEALLYPFARDAIARLATLGRPAVLSDGDIVFQPRKIQRAGLWAAVEGRVLIFVHKERSLDTVRRRFPAEHYVMIDDKPNLLAAMKRELGAQMTGVFVRQGHYALAADLSKIEPSPDRTVEHIGDLRHYTLNDF
jgi:FMN phosphatase YigB (HAD superfamily)